MSNQYWVLYSYIHSLLGICYHKLLKRQNTRRADFLSLVFLFSFSFFVSLCCETSILKYTTTGLERHIVSICLPHVRKKKKKKNFFFPTFFGGFFPPPPPPPPRTFWWYFDFNQTLSTLILSSPSSPFSPILSTTHSLLYTSSPPRKKKKEKKKADKRLWLRMFDLESTSEPIVDRRLFVIPL